MQIQLLGSLVGRLTVVGWPRLTLHLVSKDFPESGVCDVQVAMAPLATTVDEDLIRGAKKVEVSPHLTSSYPWSRYYPRIQDDHSCLWNDDVHV